MSFEGLQPYLAFFATYRYAVVFVAAAIDSTGVPFPGRLILIVAGAMSGEHFDAAVLVLLAAAGAIVGDHALYVLGWTGGDRVLRFYCKWTIGSAHCVRKAQDYFERFGGATIFIGRFVAGVRIFAVVLAGAGGIGYVRFLLYDVLGALASTGLFVLLGYWLGARAGQLLEPYGHIALIVGLALVVAGVGVIAYRVWKRRRHTPATVMRAAR
jgi:membrane protein DedA with SNARE-associated domain